MKQSLGRKVELKVWQLGLLLGGAWFAGIVSLWMFLGMLLRSP